MKSKALLIFNVLLVVYLLGFTLLYMSNRFEHESFLKTLVDVRQSCKTAHPEDFSAYISCLKERSQTSKDSTVRPIVSVPTPDFTREYVIMVKEKKGSWISRDLVLEKKEEILSANLLKEVRSFNLKEFDSGGILRSYKNYNFGEFNIEVTGEEEVKFTMSPYSQEGFLLFDLGSSWLVIKTKDMPNEEIEEAL